MTYSITYRYLNKISPGVTDLSMTMRNYINEKPPSGWERYEQCRSNIFKEEGFLNRLIKRIILSGKYLREQIEGEHNQYVVREIPWQPDEKKEFDAYKNRFFELLGPLPHNGPYYGGSRNQDYSHTFFEMFAFEITIADKPEYYEKMKYKNIIRNLRMALFITTITVSVSASRCLFKKVFNPRR